MSEQAATYAPETITPAVAAQRGQRELADLRDALAVAKGRADALSPEPEGALAESMTLVASNLTIFRAWLACLLDDCDAAIEIEASRVDAALRKEAGR